MRKAPKMVAVATAVALMAALGMSAPATSALPVSPPIAEGLAGPLGMAIDGTTVYVSQAFGSPSTLTTISPDGTKTDVADGGKTEGFSGLSIRDGVVVFTASSEDDAVLGRLVSPHHTEVIASPHDWEADHNPDAGNSYGFQNLDPACVTEVSAIPDIPGGGLPYGGEVDSNPYGVASMPDGSWIVADAGGNDLVGVQPDGTMRTVAVLPPIPYVVPDGAPFPPCTYGKTFNFEPVPTDVELGSDGMLYVSSLPGGPEDASFGARGSVFRVDPGTGASTVIATGFAGATGLALGPDGSIYVAEAFGNRVSKVVGSGSKLVAEVEAPAAIEFANGKLYVTIRALPPEGPPEEPKAVVKADGPPVFNGAVVTIDLPESTIEPPTTAPPPTTVAQMAAHAEVSTQPKFTG